MTNSKTKKIIDYLIDLYDIKEKEAETMLGRIDKYEEAFQYIREEDLITAIKNYWKFKNDKIRPKVNQILAMLPEKLEKEIKQTTFKISIPNDLQEIYQEAIEWKKKVLNPSYFYEHYRFTALRPSIVYALNKAEMDFERDNQSIIGEYSGYSGKVEPCIVFALFYKHTNNPTDLIIKIIKGI